MAVELAGITLSGSIQWTNRYQNSLFEQTGRYTLGGRFSHYTKRLERGRSIVLEATNDTGWFQKSMVDALLALGDGVYTLNFHGEVYTVKLDFREGDSMSFNPIKYKVPQEQDDYFTGQIRLFTV